MILVHEYHKAYRETVAVDGRVVVTPESLVFDIDDSGRIVHLAVYIQRQP